MHRVTSSQSESRPPEEENVWEELEIPESQDIPQEESKEEDSQGLSDLLNEMKLGKYEERLVQHGISNLNRLAEADESALDELKIPLGHKLKLLKKIKSLQKELCAMEPIQDQTESIQGIMHEGSSEISPEKKKVRFAEGGKETPIQVIPEEKPKMVTGETQYNEIEALSTQTDESTKKVWDPNWNNKEGEMERALPEEEEQKSCWQCYKLVNKSELIFDCITEKRFCS